MEIKKNLLPNEQLLHIKDEYVDITVINNHGIATSKSVDHDDFLKVLSSSVRSTQLSSSQMKDFQLGANIVKFRQSDEGFYYYFLLRKGKYPFNNEGKRMKIHYPNVLFKLGVDKNYDLKDTKIYVLKDEDIITSKVFGVESISIKDDAQVYQYPIGNVYTDGDVCWGGIVFPTLDTYMSIIEVVNTFLESPTNEHMAADEFKDEQRPISLKKLESESFDEDMLLPCIAKSFNLI